MKKLFLSLAVVASSLAFSQTVGFGAKAGINVSNMTNKGQEHTLDKESSKVGFHAGVFVNVPLGANFSVQPEVLYNNLGQKTDFKFGSETVSVKNNMDYISVPVMAQYNIAEGFYLEAGPQFSFLVDQKYKISGVKNETIKKLAEDALNVGDSKKNYKSFDLGLGVGAGYKIYKNIGINARYVVGLTNDTDIKDVTVKNNSFHAGVSIGF